MKIHIYLEQICRPLILLELEILNLKENALAYMYIYLYVLTYNIRYSNPWYYCEAMFLHNLVRNTHYSTDHINLP